MHAYEVRPRKDKRGVDLISDALPFGRLWYGEPDAISDAVRYAQVLQRLAQTRRNNSCLGNFNHCDAVIFIPTNVAALNPSNANSVALNSGIAKSVHVQNRKTPPSITFHTIN